MKVSVYRDGKWLVDLTNDEVYSYDNPIAKKLVLVLCPPLYGHGDLLIYKMI